MASSDVFDRYSCFLDIAEGPLEFLWLKRWRKELLNKLHGKILEVGIGTGKSLGYYSQNADITAIDISSRMIEKASKKARMLGKKVEFGNMPAENITYKDNTFDYVVCFLVLCSVNDPVKALEEMKRVCKKIGEIIIVCHTDSRHAILSSILHILKPVCLLSAGCNPVRKTEEDIKKAGLKITEKRNLALDDVFKMIVCRKP